MTNKMALSEQLSYLPTLTAIRFLDDAGNRVDEYGDYSEPDLSLLIEAHRRMVLGRALDTEAVALAKQGYLVAYPPSQGQEACQVGIALGMQETDWLFPTYREIVALTARGIDPLNALAIMRGITHGGYNPYSVHTAPLCTPLATHGLHAAGFAYGEQSRGHNTVAVACMGDGATSEGDFHEALNFAGVFKAPVVFFIQNNGYAISTPYEKQTAAAILANRGIGYGVPAEQVDGNDVMAVLAVMHKAAEHARAGKGPFLIEAHTYRYLGHSTNDNPTRYRENSEVEAWRLRDPIVRIERYLKTIGAIDDEAITKLSNEAAMFVADLRDRIDVDVELVPDSMFEHVYASPTPQLNEQREQLATELA